MDDPYQAPESYSPTRDSFGMQWHRLLGCPYCGQMTVKAWRAWMRSPGNSRWSTIRCNTCSQRSRITLAGALRWKYWVLWSMPIVVLVIGYIPVIWLHLDSELRRQVRDFVWSLDLSPATLRRLVFWFPWVGIAPLFVSTLLVLRITLKIIATHAILIRVVETPCSKESASE